MTMKFREKPAEVEAFQWLDDPHLDWPDWFIEALNRNGLRIVRTHERFAHVAIETPEGVMCAQNRDWIVLLPNGEIYPYAPGNFEVLYEPVVEDAV